MYVIFVALLSGMLSSMQEGFPLVLVTSVERFGIADFFCHVLMFVFVIFVDKSCYGCGETGHISRNCPKKKGNNKLHHHHYNEV